MIPSDMTVLLDESPPVVKFILIQGGKLIFDDVDDLHLQSEMILITSGGLLQVTYLEIYFISVTTTFYTRVFLSEAQHFVNLKLVSTHKVEISIQIPSRLELRTNPIQRKQQLQCMVTLDLRSFPFTEQRALPSERGIWSFMVRTSVSLCNNT